MNSIITQKMKDQFLLLLPKWCAMVKTTAPLLEYEFSLATKWYVEQLPLLQRPDQCGSDYIVDTVKHLVSDGFLNQEGLKFKLTKQGADRVNELSAPAKDDNNDRDNKTNKNLILDNWLFRGVVTGIVILFIWHNVLDN